MRPNEIKRSYVFETDDLFVIAGFVANNGQSFETVLNLIKSNMMKIVSQMKKGLKYCSKRNSLMSCLMEEHSQLKMI